MKIIPQKPEDLDQSISDLLGSYGYYCEFRKDSNDTWTFFYNLLEHQPIVLSNHYIDYQLEYERGNGRQCIDLSLLIKLNNQVVAMWILSVNTNKEGQYLASLDRAVLAPYFEKGLSHALKDKITKHCYRAAITLANQLGQRILTTQSYDMISPSLPCWHIYAMQQGALTTVRHQALIDLSEPLADIKSSFRKSYKSLINKSRKLWQTHIYTSNDIDSIWNDFIRLHIMAAGRATRSEKSWQLQKEAILANQAFLVAVFDGNHDDGKRLIGGGYFFATKHEGTYGTGAYDRRLFDQPVSHIVQLKAIEELQNRGCRLYSIGQLVFSGDIPKPTDKELSISLFKSGFANMFKCFFLFSKEVDSLGMQQ